MSFFGLEQNDLLEKEKQQFLQGGKPKEDLAVYTWGEESYDGLGDALQEGGDDFNDETFGGSGPVGKDFDFTGGSMQGLSLNERQSTPASSFAAAPGSAPQASHQPETQAAPRQPSLWDEKSPFSVLPRSGSSARLGANAAHESPRTSALRHAVNGRASPSTHSPLVNSAQAQAQGSMRPGRTLEEIEAEMRGAAQRAQNAQIAQDIGPPSGSPSIYGAVGASPSLQSMQSASSAQSLAGLPPVSGMLTQRQQILQEQQEHQSRWWQQQRNAPPRMHPQSQSPRFHSQHQQQQLIQQQQQQQQLLQQQQLREQVLEQQYQAHQQQLREQELERQLLEQERERQIREQILEQQLLEEQQRELLLREQRYQRQIQQELHLQELQEQARQEELERALRAERAAQLQQQQLMQGRYLHERQSSNPAALAELAAMQAMRHGSPSIEALYAAQHGALPPGPQRQRIMAEYAQAEFMRDFQAASPEEQEQLRAEAMRRIMETERMEEKRRRKAAKIAHMSRYNDLMTQSDKDFITRIQVSQLVTQDPYAEDFYAQVYGAILRSRMGMNSSDERVLKFGNSGGVGLGMGQRGAGRRPNALQRMEQQVERIVNNARQRERERGMNPVPDTLHGALGKTAGRSYKTAPRQLLQVSSPSHEGAPTGKSEGQDAAKAAAKMGAERLGVADPNADAQQDPLTKKEALAILENMYDLVLRLEQLRREQPPPDDEDFEMVGMWNAQYNESVQQLWDGMRVMVPLETSDPHPFIALLTPAKGKKLLPRISRHLSSQQMLTVLTLLVACFAQMDVVAQAPILDHPGDTFEQRDLERQTQTFLGSVVQSVLPVVAKAGLRLVSGLLGLLLERTNIIAISQTRPGLAFLTLFLSRVEVIKQSMSSATDVSELPSQEETEQWELMFDHLFELLAPHLVYLFPSTRLMLNTPPGVPAPPPAQTDALDHSVWQFLAALALHASNEQQQTLVTALREKVLENVAGANHPSYGPEERAAKLANVNLFLHALGLDSSQITL
ncbi:unnamed protein product [Peniophora sp. CBMAI 1063]|nr:unnamed protein product [Peniophora sp. CBMAI 1063]